MTDWPGRGLVASRLSRRQLFGAGASALVLTACGPQAPSRSVDSPSPSAPSALALGDLMAEPEFYIAHRGSYDNWVEHTMEAYQRSVDAGAQVIEVSVNATSDGVLVCHHDQTTERLASQSVLIAKTPWAELSKIQVDARNWLGPSAALQPIPRFADVLKTFAGRCLMFVEDKQGTNTEALLDLFDQYPDAKDHIVWKQWAAADQWSVVKKRGYRRWGYYTVDIMDRLHELASRFDYLGIPAEATDAQVRKFLGFKKPTIVYEVHRRSTRDHMRTLGVQGFMCSNLPYVTSAGPGATADAFGTGLRAAGDLPWTTDDGPSVQPDFDVLTSALSIGKEGIQSYGMGSLCPITATTYTISFALRWPDTLPDKAEHAGIAFAQADDRPYRVRIASELAGYHMVIRANGAMELFARTADTVGGTQLGVVPTGAPEAGQWMTFHVTVSPDRVCVAREGLTSWQLEVDHSFYRGGYFSLCKNYPAPTPVQFRTVTIS